MGPDRLADVALRISHFRDIADVAHEVFGPLTGTTEERLAALRAAYRRLTLVVHPDRFAAGSQEAWLAQETFVKVTNLKNQMEARILQDAPLLPGGPAHRSPARRAEPIPSDGIVVHRPRPVTGYDEPSHPPLPNCVCIELARKNLPYRTIYCYAGQNKEFATVYGEKKNIVEHGGDCAWFRDTHSSTIVREVVYLSGQMIAIAMNGWYWEKGVL